MSIPLVRNNTKDAINTSIIAIKKNLERINSLLGLVDSSEPDLSGFATKQELEDTVTEINNTIDEVETSLQPVDTVTSGDMHSVTSNAVAQRFINTQFDLINHEVDYSNRTVHYDCNDYRNQNIEIFANVEQFSNLPNYTGDGLVCWFVSRGENKNHDSAPNNALRNIQEATIIYFNGSNWTVSKWRRFAIDVTQFSWVLIN